eukprot:113345_1
MLTMQPVNIDINIERSNLNDNDEDIFMSDENSQSYFSDEEVLMLDDNILAISFDCHTILQNNFKHKAFRGTQLDIIIHTITGGDGLALLPTGVGKSLCYQLPAIYSAKPALVVSPLISLINNQISSLKAKGINATSLTKYACELNGQVQPDKPDIIYSTPESLCEDKYPNKMKALRDIYSKYGLSVFAVDEAHTLPTWGTEFRFDYENLYKIREYFNNVPCLALTATATENNQNAIVSALKFGQYNHEVRYFISSVNRNNLIFKVKEKKTIFMDLVHHKNIPFYQAGSTIIYCPFQKDCKHVAAQLQKHKVTTAAAYHGGLSTPKRDKIQKQWQQGHIQTIVATTAFGLGIDKPNVRYVIIYGLPKTVADFYQQAGRAGRDGIESNCLLFYSTRVVHNKNKRIDKIEHNIQNAKAIAEQRWLELLISPDNCKVQIILNYFGEEIAECKSRCDSCLAKQSAQVDATNNPHRYTEIVDHQHGQSLPAQHDIDNKENDEKSIETPQNVSQHILCKRRISNNIDEIIIYDSRASIESLAMPFTMSRHSIIRDVINDKHELSNHNKNKILSILSGTTIQCMHFDTMEDILFKREQCTMKTSAILFRINYVFNYFQLIQQTQQTQQTSIALPNLNRDTETYVNPPLISDNMMQISNDNNVNPVIATAPWNNAPEVGSSTNDNQELTVDLTAINNQLTQIERNKNQRSRIDTSISNIPHTIEKNVLWSKTVNGKKIERYLYIDVTKTSSKVLGQWMEMDNDSFKKMNKTWASLQKHKFLIGRLKYHFNMATEACGKSRSETFNIFCQKMMFKTKDIKIGKLVMIEVVKMCKSLISPGAIVMLLEDTILSDDCLSEDNVFLEIFQQFKNDFLFDNVLNDIYNYILNKLIEAEKITELDDICNDIFNNWHLSNNRLSNWDHIRNKINQFKLKYEKENKSDEEFQGFFTSCLTIVEETILEQLKNKAIGAIYRSPSESKFIIVKYTSFSVGGSRICKMIAYYKKFKKGVYLHGLNRLIAKPKDKRIPLRIIDEMQTKETLSNYVIMHPDLEELTTMILHQAQAEMCMIIRITSGGHVKKVIENILRRQDCRQKFHDLYKDWTMKKLTKLSESKINDMNLKESVRDVIEGYYKMYTHGIVNRYNCYIVRSREYNKAFIALRPQKKYESMKNSKTNPFNT